jgi:hypothetical protein
MKTLSRLFTPRTPPADKCLRDLQLLRETLTDILDSGMAPRPARRGEAGNRAGVVYEPITPAQAADFRRRLAEVRAEEARLRARL